MRSLDWVALRAGCLVALVFAVPFIVAANIVADGDSGEQSSAPALLILCALLGYVIGAGVAAWLQQRRLPLMHGIVCAIAAYVVPQTILVIRKVVIGDSVNWLAAFFNLTAVVFAGLLGGGLGSALIKRGLAPRSMAGRR